MDKKIIRTGAFGMLAEKDVDLVTLAQETETKILTFIKGIIADTDDDRKAAKIMGLTLASLEFEEVVDNL